MEKHPLHLKIPELQKSEEVELAVEKQERLTEEKIPNNPNERIEAYMDRLENIFLNPNERVRERNLEMVKNKIYDNLLIKKENFPESYFELQKRVAREQGHGDIEITPEMRDQMMNVAIEDQKHSLDQWTDYLTSEDAVYPAWFKYYAWSQVIKLSQFDKERGEFKKRTDSTVAPYPDIYREPLAELCDLYEKVKEDNKALKDDEVKRLFSERFPSAYAELIQKSLASQIENQEEIKGEWIKYEQGSMNQAEKLYESLEGKGTGWCTAGKSTAEAQVEQGDFYVYYTNDSEDKPTQPRLAIRMNGQNKIGEIRGILPHQNVEPMMQEVLDKKLNTFGDAGDIYREKSYDMQRLTKIEEKTKSNQELSKEDLIFLYEINRKIEGFGYDKDPRIEEIRGERNIKEDAPIILECKPEEIATNESEITENTKAYIGKLFPNIFKTNINPDNIYTSFPEGKIQKYETQIGGKTKDELMLEMQEKNINISDYAKDMLNSQDFTTQTNQENLNLVRLTVKDLGFPNGTTTDEIYKKAEEFGLELCPAEVGPSLRLSYLGKDYMVIAMKQITDRDGRLRVFDLYWYGGKLVLSTFYAKPSNRWDDYHKFIFRSRKS